MSSWEMVLLILAVFRLSLEFLNYREKLRPVTEKIWGDKAERFHRAGFYCALGYVVFSTPAILASF